MLGTDFGTMNILKADDSGIKAIRNVFLPLPQEQTSKKQLKRMSIPFVEIENQIYLLGQDAFDYSNVFNNQELCRPMEHGLLNPREENALPILRHMVGGLVGPAEPGELAVYSVPGQTIDAERKVDYHQDVLAEILQFFGYTPKPLVESIAVANVGLKDDGYTGIAASFGAGQINLCVMFKGLSALQFSLARSGDWVSQQIARDCGISEAKANKVKETPNYSVDPKSTERRTREQQASKTYYSALIRYALANIAHMFNSSDDTPVFPEKVPFVIAGGTAMVPGFIELFKAEFTQEDFPIPLGDIRLVEEPFTAVARGCLEEAKLSEEDDD